MKSFSDRADIQISFQPFQLYPQLKRWDPNGVDKHKFFVDKWAMQGVDEAAVNARFKGLQGAWTKEGLKLSDREGGWGNSFDAQRLISFSRKQGREDQMIEAIYTANHEQNLPLSNWSVLLKCAEGAGVVGAEEMLKSDQEVAEVSDKVKKYVGMGINAVPVIILNDQYRIDGAPEAADLQEILTRIIEKEEKAML